MAIATGFEQAVRALGVLRKSAMFDPSEIDQFGDQTAEARAATLSYLLNAIESGETDEAAMLQGRRLKRERRDEP